MSKQEHSQDWIDGYAVGHQDGDSQPSELTVDQIVPVSRYNQVDHVNLWFMSDGTVRWKP